MVKCIEVLCVDVLYSNGGALCVLCWRCGAMQCCICWDVVCVLRCCNVLGNVVVVCVLGSCVVLGVLRGCVRGCV